MLLVFGQATTGTNEVIDNWETSTPEEQGMDSKKLEDLKEHIKTKYSDMYSMIVIRNGFLVEEEYFRYSTTTKRNIFSCTKSFTSTLIGLALQEGFIDCINDPVLDFFPEHDFTNVDERKQNMTLYHLLTMTTGLEWSELQIGYSDPNNSLYKMWESNDWVQYVLDQKMVEKPGINFNYNTGASHIMSAIINQTTGMSTLEFAKSRLFDPLDIEDFFWPSDPNGIPKGGEGLEITPRSLAKLGQLYLNNGSWKEQQIVNKEWVFNSSRIDHHPPGNYSYGYGFQWWIHPNKEIFSAWGYAEQRVIVVPKYQLVTVFTSYMPNVYGDPASDFVNTFIIPAITEFTDVGSSDNSATTEFTDVGSSDNSTTAGFLYTLPIVLLLVTLRKYLIKK
jgi:CubicO group peptidase (beta-lactamase class C family)